MNGSGVSTIKTAQDSSSLSALEFFNKPIFYGLLKNGYYIVVFTKTYQKITY